MNNSIFWTLALATLVLVGCGKSNRPGNDHGPDDHGHAHPPDDEEKTAQITVWSGRYEIFAEHPAFAANKPTRLITHVTDITTGEPRRSGLIKFVFAQGDDRFEHPQAEPERPGVYISEITFPKSGDWTAILVLAGDADATVNLGAMKAFPDAQTAQHADFPEPPEGIPFLKEQQWRILAKHQPVPKRTVVERVALHATVVPGPGTKAMVHPAVAGTLIKAADGAVLGTRVKAGELIALVQPAFGEFSAKLIEAEADAIRAKAAFDQAQITFDRTKRLFEQQAKSQREMQEAEAALRIAQASHEASAAVQKLYNASGTTFENGGVRVGVTAPIDGVIDRVFASLGARVTPDEPIFSVINSAAAFVRADVPETRLGDIDPNLGARFLPSGHSNAAPPIRFVALGQEIDSTTRTAPLTFAFESPNQRIPLGSAGTLEVGGKQATEALAIPAVAIVEEDGTPVVFVQVSGETYQKRDLILGVRDGPWVEAKSGVREGERVMTDGAYILLLSTKSGTIPAHGHAH